MNAKHKINVMTVQLCGQTWNLYVIDSNDDVTLDDIDADAETDFESREIHFKTLNERVVLHEIMHVYVWYTYTHSAALTGVQMEEICCDIIGYRGPEIISNGAEIYKKLKALT